MTKCFTNHEEFGNYDEHNRSHGPLQRYFNLVINSNVMAHSKNMYLFS